MKNLFLFIASEVHTGSVVYNTATKEMLDLYGNIRPSFNLSVWILMFREKKSRIPGYGAIQAIQMNFCDDS